MTSISFGGTHEGRVRDHNEDTFADAFITTARGEFHLVLVADGMGGHAQGEVASAMAAGAVREYVEYGAWRDPARALHDAFALANERVHATAGDMGTTLVAALIDERSGRYWVENVGDSRAYLVDSGALTPLTNDHSAIALRVAAGQLTREEASHAKGRNVLLRAIGPDAAVESDSFGPFVLRPGQRLLLCSDGLHSMVSEEGIARLAMAGALAELPTALIEAANAAGGEDNITAVVAAMPAADPTVLDIHGRPPRRRRRVSVSQLAPVAAAFAVLVASGAIAFVIFGGDGSTKATGSKDIATAAPAAAGAPLAATATPTRTAVGTPSATPSNVAAAVPTPSAPEAATKTAQGVASPTPVATTALPVTGTATTTPSPTATATATPTASGSPTPTPSPSPSPTTPPTPTIQWAATPFATVESAAGYYSLTVSWSSPTDWTITVEASADSGYLCSARASTGACTIVGVPAGTHTVTLKAVGSSFALVQQSVSVPLP